MKKNPTISSESLEDEMIGSSVFGAFSPCVLATVNPASAKTEVPATPDNNGNTGKPRKRSRPGNAGTMRNTTNTTRRGKSGKSGNTDKVVAKTYKIPPELIVLVDRVAYWQRRDKQDVVAEALLRYFEMIPDKDKAEIKRKR